MRKLGQKEMMMRMKEKITDSLPLKRKKFCLSFCIPRVILQLWIVIILSSFSCMANVLNMCAGSVLMVVFKLLSLCLV